VYLDASVFPPSELVSGTCCSSEIYALLLAGMVKFLLKFDSYSCHIRIAEKAVKRLIGKILCLICNRS